jgi:hypothetical protein
MSDLDEIEAMKTMAAALEPLDEAARQRALQWVVSRFRTGRAPVGADFGGPVETGGTGKSDDQPAFGSFAELFEAANPTIDRERALVAAYWVQVCEAQPSFAAQTLNAELKHLGHPIGNITEALSALKSERPALVLQLKKSGTSQQARKTYKLTTEGVRRVQTMMRGAANSEE